MPVKLYFYGEDGREISHPYNGSTLIFAGSAIARDWKLACDTDAPILRDHRGRFGRVEIEAMVFEPTRRKTFITARDFGLRRLLVKSWCSDRQLTEWSWLTDRPELIRFAKTA